MEISVNYEVAKNDVKILSDVGTKIDKDFPSDEVETIREFNDKYFGTSNGSMKKYFEDVVNKTENYCKISEKYISNLENIKNEVKVEVDNISFNGTSEFSGIPELSIEETAKKLLDSGKMDGKNYAKTIEGIKKALALLDSGEMDGKNYAKTIEGINEALALLNSGKMSEESYAKIIEDINKAMNLLASGKMSEELYTSVIDTINEAMNLLESGKISEEELQSFLSEIAEAMSLLEAGKITEEEFARKIEEIRKKLGLKESGKIDKVIYPGSETLPSSGTSTSDNGVIYTNIPGSSSSSSGGYSQSTPSSEVPSSGQDESEIPLEPDDVEIEDEMPLEDDIIEDDQVVTKIPTVDGVDNSKRKSGGSVVVPIVVGLSAAAAAGIGAKAYMDRKNNNDNGEDEEINLEDWSDEDTLEIDDGDEGISEDYLEEDPIDQGNDLKYSARTSEELADLQ